MNGFYSASFLNKKLKETVDKLTSDKSITTLVTILFITNNGGRYEERAGKEDCLKKFCLLRKIKLHRKYTLKNNRKVFIGKKDNTSIDVLQSTIENFENLIKIEIKSIKVMNEL